MISTDEYMSSPVVTLSPTSTVHALSEMMDANNIGSVVVVDDAELVGIITERDVIRKLVAKGKDPQETTVGEIMTKNVITIEKSASLMEVASLMKQHTMRRLVVVENNEPVGIITSRDLISLLV